MLVVYMGRIGTPDCVNSQVRHLIGLLALMGRTILCSDLICVKVLPLYNSGRRLLSPEEQQQHSRVEVPTLRQALPRLKSHSLSGQNPRKKSCFSQPVSHLQGPLQQSCLDQAALLFVREKGRSSTSGRQCYPAQEPWPNMTNNFISINAICHPHQQKGSINNAMDQPARLEVHVSHKVEIVHRQSPMVIHLP